MLEIIIVFSPFLITFAVQLLLCRFVKHKVFRHASLLISLVFVILLIILLFSRSAPVPTEEFAYADSDDLFLGNMYSAFFVMSIVGYGLAWLIYAVIMFFRKKRNYTVS